MNTKNKISILLLFAIGLLVNTSKLQAQDEKLQEAQVSSKSTSTTSGQNILVIPFQTSMYYCNNDQFICQQSHITPGELNQLIRESVAANLVNKLTENYVTTGVSEKRGDNPKSDVESIYSITKYSLENKPLVAYYRNVEEGNGIKNMFGLKKEHKGPEYLNPAKPNLKSHRYFRAQFTDLDKLSALSKAYGISNVLFIDHFEMETHFKDCADMHKQVSQRDLYVHYTLLDNKGKFKDGGVVCMTFQSNSNDIKEIMKSTLPSISNMIITEIKPVLTSLGEQEVKN